MRLILVGLLSIIIGAIYFLKPNVFRVGFWKQTSVMQRSLSPESYGKTMKGLGIFLLVQGIVLLAWGLIKLS